MISTLACCKKGDCLEVSSKSITLVETEKERGLLKSSIPNEVEHEYRLDNPVADEQAYFRNFSLMLAGWPLSLLIWSKYFYQKKKLCIDLKLCRLLKILFKI